MSRAHEYLVVGYLNHDSGPRVTVIVVGFFNNESDLRVISRGYFT